MKVIETKYTCDICKEIIPCGAKYDIKPRIIQVVFTTEQNEGRSVKPYLSGQSMHICTECENKLITRYPLIGCGAQGYNEYNFKKVRDELI
jgi:hypothetical protein